MVTVAALYRSGWSVSALAWNLHRPPFLISGYLTRMRIPLRTQAESVALANSRDRRRATPGWKLNRKWPGARGRDGRWYSLHKACWEAYNGSVPVGSVVHHRDKNTSNFAVENLECMTRAEHLAFHQKR